MGAEAHVFPITLAVFKKKVRQKGVEGQLVHSLRPSRLRIYIYINEAFKICLKKLYKIRDFGVNKMTLPKISDISV